MSTGPRSEHAGQVESFIWGLQFSAALMMAHQIAGKAARDGLFLLYHTPRDLPAMIAGAAFFSIALSLSGGALLRRVGPRVMLPWALGVSGALQVCEWSLLRINPGIASIVIYLHMAGVGVVFLSAFWSMLNEEFDPREAKRKFGRIAAGGTAGGLAGGLIAERTVAWAGSANLMFVLAGLHLACGIFFAMLIRGRAAPPSQVTAASPKAAVTPPHRSQLLLTLVTLVLLGSIGAALLDYVFKVYATETWGKGKDLVRGFAFFYTGISLATLVLQSVASKLFLEKFGLGNTILTLPATLAAGSTAALLAPGFLVVAIARIAEAAVRGSLFRAGYETCYTPVPPGQKRLAKTFIDVGSDRAGDAFGAAIIYGCLTLAGASALPWILTVAALLGICSLILCRTLDRTYVKALAKSLESRVVEVEMDSNLDLTTRSLVIKRSGTQFVSRGTSSPRAPSDVGGTMLFRTDPVLRQLSGLRSDDVPQVRANLDGCDVSDPLIATQVCMLLGRDEYARLAQAALVPHAGKVLGLLTDLMLDTSLDLAMRRRIPRIIASIPGQRAVDTLLAGLNDHRFEVRLHCARSLVKVCAQEPHPAVQAGTILAAVDRELAIGKVLWESHQQQHQDSDGSGTEWLDDIIRDKAHGSLEYVFTLLSVIHDRAPLMAAFRSLHLGDRYLRGTALEYLEGILPTKTHEMLWDILQERPPKTAARAKGEIVQELLQSSETIVLRFRDKPM